MRFGNNLASFGLNQHLPDSRFESMTNIQLLPYDGEVEYYGVIFQPLQQQHYFEELMTSIPWQNDEAVMFGKHLVTARKVAWYGSNPYPYTYSRKTKVALYWNEVLKDLLSVAQEKTAAVYNSCLLNLYHNGKEGMAYHSDDEKALIAGASIASLTFGAGRKFLFKHKVTGEKVEIFLEPGSLLVMKGATQQNWLHRLPPTTKVTTARINLTFRRMAETTKP